LSLLFVFIVVFLIIVVLDHQSQFIKGDITATHSTTSKASHSRPTPDRQLSLR